MKRPTSTFTSLVNDGFKEEGMLEKNVEKALVMAVKKQGGMCIKINSVSMNGLPDRLVILHGGKCAGVELKAPGEKPRKLQVRRHKQLSMLGQKVYVIDEIDKIQGVLDEIQST